MANGNINVLIAENNQVNNQNNNSNLNQQAQTQHTTAQTAESGHHSEEQMTPNDVFPHLLGELGDHQGLYVGPYHVAELPVIIYDQGFHVYTNPQQMQQEGLFTVQKGKNVRTSDHQPVTLDLSITNLVFYELLAVVILTLVFTLLGRKYKKRPTEAPSGFQNAVEAIIEYLHNELSPNLTTKTFRRLFPYFIALFFFILLLNIFGLIPGGHSATGTISVTAGLAIISYIVINMTSIREIGFGNWLKHLLGGAPIGLAPIMIPIEIISMFTKPFALTIRLFANMIAGHVVILSLIGLIFYFKLSLGTTVGIGIVPVSVGFSVFMYFLETLVALLQAYIFTMLTAVFIGLGLGEHAQEHEH